MRPRHAVLLTFSSGGHCPLWCTPIPVRCPYLSPLFATLTKTAGLCTQNSQSGTLCCAFANLLRYHYSSPRNTCVFPRKCCKQKTYGMAKPFRCNTYKKTGGYLLQAKSFSLSSPPVPLSGLPIPIPYFLPPIPFRFMSLRTLLRSFARERNSTLLFSMNSALFHKNRGVWGTPGLVHSQGLLEPHGPVSRILG
jgi:hypothetical protein